MHATARAAFGSFTERFEALADWLYADVKGFVTIGRGDLIDPIALTSSVTFVHPESGAIAHWSDVTAAWQRVKLAPGTSSSASQREAFRKRGGGAFRGLTTIRATRASLDAIFDAKVARFEGILAKAFPEWDTWPARAQLATMSMAWALGPYFSGGWPLFTAAARAQDWAACALPPPGRPQDDPLEHPICWIRESDNKPIHARNVANVQLFRDAAHAVVMGAPVDEISQAA